MNIYLLFREDIENIINNESEGKKIIDNLKIILDRIGCEKDTSVYYDSENKNHFIDNLKLLQDMVGNFGTLDFETSLHILLRELEAEYIDNTSDNIFKVWNIDNQNLEDDFPNILKTGADKIILNQQKAVLMNIDNAFSFNRAFIPILKDNRNDNSIVKLPQIAHLFFVNDFENLEKWFEENRKERNYNSTDNRHVVGINGYIQGKAPIIGGQEGKKKLAVLLETALGNITGNFKDLINWDAENECYVWFEFENHNPQNQYHGYHLVYPPNHQNYLQRNTSSTGEKKIPEKIKDILKYKQEN